MGERARSYRRLVMAADMERYSARSTVQQHTAQEVFLAGLDAAGAAAGLDRGAWRRQSSGDGEMAVLPADVDEPALVSSFLLGLDRYLRPYNEGREPHTRIRVRVAVNQGLLYPDSRNGFAGEPVNTAARLVDAPVLKEALRAFDKAAVACIVSEGIHRDVVTGGYEGIRPDRFREVRVTLKDKGFDEQAWLQVVDEDVTSIELGTDGQGPGSDRPPAAPEQQRRDAPSGGGVSTGNIENSNGQVAVGHGASARGTNGPRR